MFEKIIQEIFVRANPDDIFEQLLVWGEAGWWPRRSLMRFKNLSGEIKLGTVYLAKIRLVFGPSWYARNVILDKENFYIKRIFLEGIFSGGEELRILSNVDGRQKVIYTFDCEVKGIFNNFIWNLISRKLHIKNIDMILSSLKTYLEKCF